ncbi:MAG: acetyl-CoA carboxylase biotin carboxyl carrier protein [Pseudomonadota bacterium]
MATKNNQQANSPAKPTQVDADLIRELASILTDTNLTEIEIERDDYRLKVSRQAPAAPATTAYVAPPVAAATAAPAPATPEPAEAPAGGGGKDHPGAVKSPMVGTAYASPSPGAAPFVKVGDRVSKGQTLLIVEAMKTMNPIPSPQDGVVKDVLFADAQPVEYGEPLVVIA